MQESLTLAINAKAKKMREAGINVAGFVAGEPDFDTPDYIKAGAETALKKGMTKYTPSAGTPALREAVCKKLLTDNGLSYSPDQIVISNGAKHSISNTILALVEEGDEVIIPAPYWLTYPELVTLAGGTSIFVHTRPENSFKMTPDELKKAITKKTKLLILNSPSNPTGAVYTKEELFGLAEVIEKAGIFVISDEIYEKLVYGEAEHYSIAGYSEKLKEQTIVINGVSKTYSMTGWRIGYLAAAKDIAKAIDNIQSHMTSNPNSIAQYATLIALTAPESKEFLSKSREIFDGRRKTMVAELEKAGFEYINPSGAFYVMVRVSKYFGMTAGEKKIDGAQGIVGGKKIDSAQGFSEALLESAQVATVPCESFGANDYIRLSYALSEKDIIDGVGRLAEFVRIGLRK
jgi:aspartate aminotransferase